MITDVRLVCVLPKSRDLILLYFIFFSSTIRNSKPGSRPRDDLGAERRVVEKPPALPLFSDRAKDLIPRRHDSTWNISCDCVIVRALA